MRPSASSASTKRRWALKSYRLMTPPAYSEKRTGSDLSVGGGVSPRSRGLIELQDSGNGFDQEDEIEPERPVPHVVAIARDAGEVAHAVAPAGLPHPCNPGPCAEIEAGVAPIARHLVRNDGSGTDEAHVPA